MMFPIKFHSDPPNRLYHYTSQEGLMGIITNHCLWATEIQYLNDASEYRYGEKLINEVISRRRKGARGKNKEFFSEYIAHASFLSDAHYFVTSLSEHGDLLSQWRGYTPDGNGFSLGFNV